MVRIKGYGLLIGLACLLAFSACGGSDDGGGGGTASTRIGITLTAVPTTLSGDGISTAAITADVRTTRDNVAVADGTEVTFSLETSVGGMISPTAVTTTVAGLATAVVTAGNAPGTVTVKAVSGTVSKTLEMVITEYIPGQTPATNLVISQVWAMPASIPIYGKTEIYAEIRDDQGNLTVDGTKVDFTASLLGGEIDASSTTTGGLAKANLTASSFRSWPDGATITVKAGSATNQSLKVNVLDLEITQITASTVTIPLQGITTITAEVRDTDGNLAPDDTSVFFSSSLLGSDITPEAKTAGGAAEATFTAGNFTGTAVIMARVGNGSIGTITLTVGISDAAITASAKPNRISIGKSSTIDVEVRTGTVLAPDGTPVYFSTDLAGATVTPEVKTVSGLVQATFTAGIKSGTATITIKSGDTIVNNIVITVVGDVASVAIYASPLTLSVYGSSNVTATLRDAANNVVIDGTEVTFSTGMTSATFSNQTAATVNGVAGTTIKMGSYSGKALITAQTGNITGSRYIYVTDPSTTITASAKPNRISIGKTSIVEVEVRSAGVLVPDGTPVYFTSNLAGAVITPMKTTISGMAQATFTAGTRGGTAAVTARCGSGAAANLSILVVGDVATIQVSMPSPMTIAVYETSTINVTVRDAAGNPVIDKTVVNFSTDQSQATFSQLQVETANGSATTTFTAGASFGTANIIVDSGGVRNEDWWIVINPPQVSSIEFTSATPLQVGVKGSGLPEVSTVVFTVKDDHGNPAPDGTIVDFTLYGPKGGEYISPLETSTSDGEAITHLQSGTVAGPVRIEASTSGGTLSTASIGISIGSGLTSYKNFSIAIETGGWNVAGLSCYGLTNNVTAFMADRYYNFVAENTSANFYAEAGGIAPTGWSDEAGQAPAIYQTQGPEPVDVAPAIYYECNFDSPLYPCSPETSDMDLFYGPHRVSNPRDGLNTILVTTIGEEEFDDKNGNGLHDTAESFVDLPEPFSDVDDDEIYDYAEPYTEGVDVNNVAWSAKVNNKYDPPTPWVDINFVDDDGGGSASDCDGTPYGGEDTTKVGNNTNKVNMNGTTLANLPVIPGTVKLYDQLNTNNYLTDDGAGNISQISRINRAFINYATGVITGTLTFQSIVPVGNSVRVSYQGRTTDCNNRWDSGKICLGELENPNPAISCSPQVNPGCVCFPGEKFWDKWLPGQAKGDGKWNDSEFYVDYNNNGRFDGPNGIWDSQTMIWRSVQQLVTSKGVAIQVRKLDPDTYHNTFCGPDSAAYPDGHECFYPDSITLVDGGSNYYLMEVSDENHNPLDKFSILTTGGGLDVIPEGVKSDDPIGQAWTYTIINVYDSSVGTAKLSPCNANIEVSVENCDKTTSKFTHTITGWCQ